MQKETKGVFWNETSCKPFAATQEIAAEPVVGQTEEALTQPQEEELPAELPEEETLPAETAAEAAEEVLPVEAATEPQENEKTVTYEYDRMQNRD